MSDIDFDELDRAVNSIMNGGGYGNEAKTKEKPTTDDLGANSNSSLSAAEANKQSDAEVNTQSLSMNKNKDSLSAKVENFENDPRPSVMSKRRSGRFMDVIHPSSDMTNSSVSVKPRPASVSYPTVEPAMTNLDHEEKAENDDYESMSQKITESLSSSFVESENANDTSAASAFSVSSDVSKVGMAIEPESLSKGISHAESADEYDGAARDNSLSTDGFIESSTPDDGKEKDFDPELSDTPFVANAKSNINKRPLGGVVIQPISGDDSAVESGRGDALSGGKSDTEEMDTSSNDMSVEAEQDSEISELMVDEALQNKQFGESENIHVGENMFEAVADQPAVQTESSHAKKKTGLLTVLLILLLLIIGVAGGALAYFFLVQ